jgi:hypothetical protein
LTFFGSLRRDIDTIGSLGGSFFFFISKRNFIKSARSDQVHR